LMFFDIFFLNHVMSSESDLHPKFQVPSSTGSVFKIANSFPIFLTTSKFNKSL